MSVFKIIPTTQQYDWGKLGSSSMVGQLAAAAGNGFVLANDKPYAELWMGTHPTSPSTLPSSKSLASMLMQNPALMGRNIIAGFPSAADGNLPFLFKVLSIEKALSIQAHPDKATAEKLHAESPAIYKDDNHKPELAIALTPFRALCGFLPLPAIAHNLTANPEFSALIPPMIIDAFLAISDSSTPTGGAEKTALKDLFSALMTADKLAIESQLKLLITRYLQTEQTGDGDMESLVLLLNSQFPGDVGVFCAFVLNYVKMAPGEAIFLGAGEPHAYVSGDIIECMANSDNVIRAGLTPKLRDIPNLVAGLTYVSADATRHRVEPTTFASPSSKLYDPPIPEFSVVQVVLVKGEELHRAIAGPSLVVVTEGKGFVSSLTGVSLENTEEISPGDVFFIGADTPIKFDTQDGLIMYRAFVE